MRVLLYVYQRQSIWEQNPLQSMNNKKNQVCMANFRIKWDHSIRTRVCPNGHILFFCTKPRLSQARALLFPKVFIPLGIQNCLVIAHLRPQIPPSPSAALMYAMNFYLNLPDFRIVSSTNNPIGVSLLVGQG